MAELIPRIEELTQRLYTSPDPVQRQQAQIALRGFSESPACIPQCQQILDQSKQPYALLLASSSLLKLITTFWNSFSGPQTVEIRDYLLSYVAQNGHDAPHFVTQALIRVIMRITKLGWHAQQEHRDILKSVGKFLAHSVAHCIIGVQMLNELVEQMNTQAHSMSLTAHRKTAVSFRDQSLRPVFQLAMTTLGQLRDGKVQFQNEQQQQQLRSMALELALKCLGFDYIGTNPDDASEEAGTIQIPTSWRGIVQDALTLRLFVDIYAMSEVEEAATCLELIVQLAACRRSLFENNEARGLFLNNMATGIVQILSTEALRAKLMDSDCYHHFCRLLGRLKSNYQLQELISMPVYRDWMHLVAKFTIGTFTGQFPEGTVTANSVHYLLALWSRMTMAIPYMKGDVPSFLDTFIPQVRNAYLDSRLEAVQKAVAMDESEVKALFDEPDLGDQLRALPALCRYKYDLTRDWVSMRYDPLRSQYAECIQHLSAAGQGQVNPEVFRQLALVENQLAVIVYTVGTIIRGHIHVSRGEDPTHQVIEAELCARAFQIMKLTDERHFTAVGRQYKCVHLEVAILYFLEWFRRAYVGSSRDVAHYGYGARALSSGSGDGEIAEDDSIFTRLSQHLGPMTQDGIVTSMLDKIVMNLSVWASEFKVISDSLELLDNLASGYSSVKLMAKLERTKVLLVSHTAADLQFMSVAANSRLRTSFYSTLSRLVFLSDNIHLFDKFMEPFERVVHMITQQAHSMRQDPVLALGIGLARDLRGVVAGALQRRSYVMFFEWLYPKYLGVILRLLETWWDTPAIVVPILRLFSELVFNKSQRIQFEPSSPNGIILFREASKAIDIYGVRLLSRRKQVRDDADDDDFDALGEGNDGNNDDEEQGADGKGDLYRDTLKGVSICLQIMSRSLSGEYVNFGVFELYNDKALSSALNTVVRLILSVPLTKSLTYIKVAQNYYCFLEVIFRNHTDLIVKTETRIFLALLSSLQDGLSGFPAQISTYCASAIDHLMCFRFTMSKKRDPSEALILLEKHLADSGNLLPELLATLFNMILFDKKLPNQWSVSRPLFSLIITNYNSYLEYQQLLASAQPPDARPRLMAAFEKLTEDVDRDVEHTSKEKFTHNLTQFRNDIATFCVKPANV